MRRAQGQGLQAHPPAWKVKVSWREQVQGPWARGRDKGLASGLLKKRRADWRENCSRVQSSGAGSRTATPWVRSDKESASTALQVQHGGSPPKHRPR